MMFGSLKIAFINYFFIWTVDLGVILSLNILKYVFMMSR